MLDLFHTPTPQQANYQEFYGGGTTQDWVKPRGASMVRFMLIGAGGGGGNGGTGNGGGGGSSGAITSWIGPAMFVPDVLRITVGTGGTSGVNATASSVIYQAKDNIGYTLLTANGGSSGNATTVGGAAAAAMTRNSFGASGIFTSIAGQQGGGSGNPGVSITASGTTFLSGGAGGANAASGGGVTPNYDYPALPIQSGNGSNGYFFSQPILVGCGGSGGGTTGTTGPGYFGGSGGLGCGGGGAGEDAVTLGRTGGRGGDGAVFIWAW